MIADLPENILYKNDVAALCPTQCICSDGCSHTQFICVWADKSVGIIKHIYNKPHVETSTPLDNMWSVNTNAQTIKAAFSWKTKSIYST